ncbi:MAG: SLBB domain-containing protein, partial [Candidatus Eisenbacteria sp.]|nr:SLBB domain-containing protein [Candidatus Eisenbacteria bacterium]
EAIPDLLQLLSQAGGPLPSADLSRVAVIRGTPSGPEVITIDVGAYMRGQTTQPLPTLEPGDTIEIPSIVGAGSVAGQGLVFIFGEVRLPGAYPAPPGTDLLQLIAIAGGTTPEARLGDVAVVMDGGDGQVVAKVDLKEVMKRGSAAPFMVAPGDRVIIPGSESDLAGQIIDGIGTAFAFSLDIMSAWLLYVTLDDRLNDRAAASQAVAP